ncbi:recombinase family protein [Streptomyces sp. NPDC059697]|uniref:recombinase family protein n=1 Tax=Streptomyces sp. NPDC059697 TaxID=3346912 RepID=UPI003681BBB0
MSTHSPTFDGPRALRGPGEPFIGYIRVSTYYEDKISPEIQRTAIEAWSKRNGKRIVDWVEDLDMTGRNFKRRIMTAIKAVEDGKARGIAVWRYSRFGRSRHGNALNLARLERVGGRLESATEAADTSTAFGRLQMGMAFKFAEFESDRIGEQWQETRENRLTRGLPATGGQRWGYIWTRRRLDEEGVLHPETYTPAEELDLIVDDLYGRIADGEPMNSACQWLGRNGYVGTRGKPWKQTGLTRYLDSGFASGWIRTHPEDCDCPPADPDEPSHRAAKCTRRIWIPGNHETIVKEDVWEAYKRRRKEAASKPRSQTAAYALSWMVKCARCGGACSIGGSSTRGAGGVLIRKNGYVFRCSEHKDSATCDGVYIRRTVAERAVLDKLAEWVEEIEAEAAKIEQQGDRAEQTDSPQDRAERARKRLQERLAEIETEQDRQTSLVSRGIIPEGSYIRERDRLAGEQLATTEELAELDKRKQQPTDRAALVPVMRGLIDRWEITPVRTRRNMLRELIQGVWAYPKTEGPDGEEIPAYAVPIAVWEPEPEPIGRRAERAEQPTEA